MLQDFTWERYTPIDFSSSVPTPSYRCPVAGCNARYPSIINLTTHCASAHYAVLPACTKCGKAFISEMYLKAHMHAKHRGVVCPKCSETFTEGGAMAMHQWIAHPGSRCDTCGKYVCQEDMAQHLLDSPNHPTCTHCNTGFSSSGTLYDHMALVHPELCCSLCHMIFSTTEHLREHHRTTRRHPSCTHCNVGFSSDAFLKKHNTLMHSSTSFSAASDGEETDTTSAFSSPTSSPQQYNLTMANENSTLSLSSQPPEKSARPPRPVRMVECKTCNIRFSRRKKLIKHYYKSPRHPVCAPCDVGFEDEEAYDMHVSKTHPPLYHPPPTPIPDSSVHGSDDATPLPSRATSPRPSVTHNAPVLPPVDTVTKRSRSPSDLTPPSSVTIRIPGSPRTIHVSLSPKPTAPTLRCPEPRPSTPCADGRDQSCEDYASVISGETVVASSPASENPPASEDSETKDDPCLNEDHGSPTYSEQSSVTASAVTVPCRACLQPSVNPLVTMCGHVFCHKCIMAEIFKTLQCPVCKKVMFVKLDM